jgi:hypothetical protein
LYSSFYDDYYSPYCYIFHYSYHHYYFASSWLQYAILPPAMQGYLQTGDSDIDAIIALSLIHAKVSMSDVYVDCPGREDGQWIEVFW